MVHWTHGKTTQTRNATNKTLSKLHLHIIYISTQFLTLFLITYHLFFFFLRESFNIWHLLLMIVLYHQTKTPISFWCRCRLSSRSFIQLSETLPVKLARTHTYHLFISIFNNIVLFESKENYLWLTENVWLLFVRNEYNLF